MALITITQSFGLSGEIIAGQVAERLGLEVFDDKKIQDAVLASGSALKEDISGLEAMGGGLLDRLFTNKPAIYLELLGSVVYDIASRGKGVIIGHAAQVFLKDYNCAFHIRLHASEPFRAESFAKKHGMKADAALDFVRRMDQRFQDFVRYSFDRDWNDLSQYDLVINLDKIGEKWAVKLVADLAESEEIQECSLEPLNAMRSSALQRKVHAAIIKHNLPYHGFHVDVIGREKVHLAGLVYSSEEHKRLLAVVREVPGVSEVTSDIVVISQPDFV